MHIYQITETVDHGGVLCWEASEIAGLGVEVIRVREAVGLVDAGCQAFTEMWCRTKDLDRIRGHGAQSSSVRTQHDQETTPLLALAIRSDRLQNCEPQHDRQHDRLDRL